MKNKILAILSIFILIICFLTTNIFAASSYNKNYDYLYDFVIDNEFTYSASEGSTKIDNLETYINSNLNDDRVESGDYYYFIFQSYFKGLQNVLVKKSAINKVVLTNRLIRNDLNTILYNIDFSDNFNSSDVVWLNGKAEYTSTGIHNISFYCDSNDNKLITNFATNYDGNIIYTCTNGDVKTFFQGTPVTEQPEIQEKTLAPILEKVEMKEPIMTTIVGLAKLLIPLLICLIGFWKAWQLLSKTLYKA